MTELLRTDVREIVRPYAGFWIRLTRRHPVDKPIADLAVYVVAIILAWILVGPTAGAAVLALTVALYGWGILKVLRRRGRPAT